jgi:hypothetical protein
VVVWSTNSTVSSWPSTVGRTTSHLRFGSRLKQNVTFIPFKVYEQFHPTHPFTKLIQEHKNVDPDVAFSCVPYEKGSAFLFYLEQKLGGSGQFSLIGITYRNPSSFRNF